MSRYAKAKRAVGVAIVFASFAVGLWVAFGVVATADTTSMVAFLFDAYPLAGGFLGAYLQAAIPQRTLKPTGEEFRVGVLLTAAVSLSAVAGVLFSVLPSDATALFALLMVFGWPAVFAIDMLVDLPVVTPFIENGQIARRSSEVNA